MPYQKHSILILHSEPRPGPFVQSDSGVQQEVEAVADALDRLGHAHRSVCVRTLQDTLGAMAGSDEPVVFNLVEDLWDGSDSYNFVPILARGLGKACTGNDTPGMLVAHDKWWAKAILAQQGLPCPKAVRVLPGHRPGKIDLPGPWIVKPCFCDGSEGLDAENVVTRPGDLEATVRHVHHLTGQPAIIEQYIEGREVNVSLIWDQQRPVVLPLAEIQFRDFGPDKPRIVGYRAKWLAGSFEYVNTIRVIPAPLSESLADQIRRLSIEACMALGCLDYCRVDLRIDEHQGPFILEVNPNPDISPSAGFAAALDAAGIEYHRFVAISIDRAVQRSAHKPSPAPTAPVKVDGCQIRPATAADTPEVMQILAATRVFRPDELSVARQVLGTALADPKEYQSYVATDQRQVVGWICFGPAPCSIQTFDIYWVVTAPWASRQGIGRSLMEFTQERIRAQGGRLIAIETSGRSAYGPARAFYEHCGYRVAARVPDFYGPSDDKLIYTKDLTA